METCLLSVLAEGEPSRNVRHFVGLPPELTGGIDSRREMGPALFLAIYAKADGIFLYRYDEKGNCVGDTWHQNVEDAKYQATFEYGERVGAWIGVSPDVEDVITFGLAQARQLN